MCGENCIYGDDRDARSGVAPAIFAIANLRPTVLGGDDDSRVYLSFFGENRACVDVEWLTNSRFALGARFRDIGIEEIKKKKQKKKRNQRLEMKLKRMFALDGTKNARGRNFIPACF